MRIVSYNVRYFAQALRGLASTRRSADAIAARIAALDPAPDLLCLQEVETRSLRSTLAFSAAGEATQLETFVSALEAELRRLGRRFPYEAYYFRAHTYRVRQTALYTTGLAVVVNRDRLRVDRHNVEAPHAITHHHVALWKEQKQSRICAHLRLTSRAGIALHLFNTHLSLPTPFARSFWAERDKMGFGTNQVQEARTLAAFVRAHAGEDPFIVCGDFNSPPGSPVYRLLIDEGHFEGAQAALRQIDPDRLHGFPTAGFFNLRMHLDHLFSGNGLRWVDLAGTEPFGSGPFHGLSDHMPLIAQFELPKRDTVRVGGAAVDLS